MDLWSKLIEWLKKNPWWGALGFLIALISVILSIIFFISDRHTKEPVYAIRSTNLIQDFTSRFDALEITYTGKRISNLTATKVAFWNNGKATINGGDIASANPLMIKVKSGYKVLDSRVLYTKEDANQVEIIPSEDGSHVLTKFDYIDKGEGGVIQLLHTGKSSDDVEVCGTIKGAGNPKRSSIGRWWGGRVSVIVSFSFPLILLLTAVGIQYMKQINVFSHVFLITMFVLYWGLGFFIIFFKPHVPKGFEIFFE